MGSINMSSRVPSPQPQGGGGQRTFTDQSAAAAPPVPPRTIDGPPQSTTRSSVGIVPRFLSVQLQPAQRVKFAARSRTSVDTDDSTTETTSWV